ncbi:hypothetical protein BDV96DRAFT_2571 [Lophiotrema nucula]|uniref:DUF6590 domain-containing protein n=1 Tax=Lophiotrema nucula TaxID=690887 RepID=A0A6A5ZUV9_9PLEO|nr:hypothetical protein BDV96DRAFT_2571 [Lophiotrema nucula]
MAAPWDLGSSEWIWSAPHQDYYYVTRKTNGDYGYHWWKDIQAGGRAREPQSQTQATVSYLPDLARPSTDQSLYGLSSTSDSCDFNRDEDEQSSRTQSGISDPTNNHRYQRPTQQITQQTTQHLFNQQQHLIQHSINTQQLFPQYFHQPTSQVQSQGQPYYTGVPGSQITQHQNLPYSYGSQRTHSAFSPIGYNMVHSNQGRGQQHNLQDEPLSVWHDHQGPGQDSGPKRSWVHDIDRRFEDVRDPRGYFKKGRVFMTLVTEMQKFNDLDGEVVKYGQNVFAKTGRFVVIRPRSGHCLCLPIQTYSGRATSKPGLKANDHAALVRNGEEVQYHPEEAPLTKEPFRLIVEGEDVDISPMSRINFGKVTTIENNVQVRTIGRIHPACLPNLERYFLESLGVTQAFR